MSEYLVEEIALSDVTADDNDFLSRSILFFFDAAASKY